MRLETASIFHTRGDRRRLFSASPPSRAAVSRADLDHEKDSSATTMANAHLQYLNQLDIDSFTDAFFETDEMAQLAASQITDDRLLSLPSQNKENIDPAVMESLDDEDNTGLGRMNSLDNIYTQVQTITDNSDGFPRAAVNGDDDAVVNGYHLDRGPEGRENVDYATTDPTGDDPSNISEMIESVDTAVFSTAVSVAAKVHSSEHQRDVAPEVAKNNEDYFFFVPDSSELFGSPVMHSTEPLDVTAGAMTFMDMFKFSAAPGLVTTAHSADSAGFSDAPYETYDEPPRFTDIAIPASAFGAKAEMPESYNDDDYRASTQCHRDIVATFAANGSGLSGSDDKLHSTVSDTLQLASLETPPAAASSQSTIIGPTKDAVDANSNGTVIGTTPSTTGASSLLVERSSESNVPFQATIVSSLRDAIPDPQPAYSTLAALTAASPNTINEPHTPKRKRNTIPGDTGGRRIPIGLSRKKTNKMELVQPVRFVMHSADEIKGKTWKGVHDRFQERKRTSE